MYTVARSLVPEGKSFPRSSMQGKNLNAPPWWNEECARTVEDRERVVQRFISHPNRNNFVEFRKARVSCTKHLAAQKRKGWRDLIGGYNSRTTMSQIRSLIKSFRRTTAQNYQPSQDLRQASLGLVSKLYLPSCYYDRTKSMEAMKQGGLHKYLHLQLAGQSSDS